MRVCGLTYIVGHQVCTACGHRQIAAWPTCARDGELQCSACGDKTARMDGPATSLRALPEAAADVTCDVLLERVMTRTLYN